MKAAAVTAILALLGGAGALAQEAAPSAPHPRIGEVTRRHSVELDLGYFGAGEAAVRSSAGGLHTTAGADGFSVAIGYSHWLRPELAVGLRVSILDSGVETRISKSVSSEVRSVFSILASLRRDFPPGARSRWRPYLTAGLGPYLGSSVEGGAGGRGGLERTRTVAAFGGQIGGGLEVQLNRLMLGGRVGYQLMTDFSSPVGGEVNYSGFYTGISLRFPFGRSPEPRE